MNTSGEVADLMVKEGLQITEEVVKLTGLGAKNLAAIVIALLKEDNKLQGKTNLKKLLKSDKPLCIMQIKESDIKKFNTEANKYGVLFTAVKDNTNDSGLCDIIAKQEDVTKLNYIMEKMGYAAPEKEIEPEPEPEKDTNKEKTGEEQTKDEHSKNHPPRATENQRESESMKHGDTDGMENPSNGKPSVRKKIEDIKAEQNKEKAAKAPEKEKTQTHTQPSKKKKKKHKKKGKSR